MNRIRIIRRLACLLAGLAAALLGAAAAPAAFAAVRIPPPSGEQTGIAAPYEPPGWNKRPPLPGQAAVRVAEHHESLSGKLPAPPLPAHIHQLVHQAQGPIPVHPVAVGMPGWQIALIAAAAALIAATVAVLVDRARTARRHQAAPSA